MRFPFVASMLLSVALVISAMPSEGLAAQGRSAQPLGTGAQFVAPGSALYVGIDLDPGSAQRRQLERLMDLYLPADQLEELQRSVLGSFVQSPERTWQGFLSWLGGEVFLAVPDASDLRSLSSSGSEVNVDCGDPGILFGAAIGNMAAFRAFALDMNRQFAADGFFTETTQSGGTDIVQIGRSPEPGGNGYLAVTRGYVLVSNSRARLVEAMGRGSDSLATSVNFRQAMTRLPERPLLAGYTGAVDQILGEGGVLPAGAPSVQWLAGSVRLGENEVRLDYASAFDQSQLSPRLRALLTKGPNPLRAPGIAPSGTQILISWDNLSLLWGAIVENVFPDRADYDRERASFARQSGIDWDEDIFNWMTGEVAIFTAPARQRIEPIGAIGMGVLIEAKDPTVAKAKLDRVMDAIERATGPAGAPQTAAVQIGDTLFRRVPLFKDRATEINLYAAMVGNWVLLTSDQGIAADVTGNVTSRSGGLATKPEFQQVRASVPQDSQLFGYVDVAELLRVLGPALASVSGSSGEIESFLRPIRSIGFGVDSTADRVAGTIFVGVNWPSTPQPLPSDFFGGRASGSRSASAILLDASRLGIEQVTFPRLGAPGADALERYQLSEYGGGRIDQIFAGQRIGRQPRNARGQIDYSRYESAVVEPTQRLLVRSGSNGPYSAEEISVYQAYARCGGSLLLLSDGKGPGEVDMLAESFGFVVAGVTSPGAVLSWTEPSGSEGGSIGIEEGSGLLGWDAYTRPIGFLSEGAYLDVDGDGEQGADDPSAAPIVALRPYGRGLIVFVGTTSILNNADNPLLLSLLSYAAKNR